MKEGVYLVYRPYFDVLGQVKDISDNGIGFQYVNFYNHTRMKHIYIDIFSGETNLQLRRVKCKVVFDIRTIEPTSSLEIRRCGMQFVKLSEREAAVLDYYIKKFAVKSNAGGTRLN